MVWHRCPDWRPGRSDQVRTKLPSARLPNPDLARKIRILCTFIPDRCDE
jgi:hypothetical protein